MKKTLLILSVLFSVSAHADDPDNVYLLKNDNVPYSGILMPVSRAERFRLMSLDLTTCNKISTLKDDEGKILQDRLTNATEENSLLMKKLSAQRSESVFDKVGYFVLGAAITTVITFGVSRTVR